jgi:3-dehydroquinate synthase
MNKIHIQSITKKYTVYFQKNTQFLSELANYPYSLFIIDKNVSKYHPNIETQILSSSHSKTITLSVNEYKKTLRTAIYLYDKIMQFSHKRNTYLISLGGGILQDLCGFIASTLYRGIPWIIIPTTLLSQADSCIGGKNALNHQKYKNMIGTFYPPDQVHVYPYFLSTLTPKNYYSGLGEIAKAHIMHSEQATQQLIQQLPKLAHRDTTTLQNAIQLSLKLKKTYIEKDELDLGPRNMLNYGHCFGHAIETTTNYRIPHGQAVILGIILSNLYAKNIGKLLPSKEQYIRTHLLLPLLQKHTYTIPIQPTVDAMKQDKKNTGNGLSLIILQNNHELLKTTISPDIATQLLQQLPSLISPSI